MGINLAKVISGIGIYRRKGDLSEGRISGGAAEGVLRRKPTELRAALNLPKVSTTARLVREEDLSSLDSNRLKTIAKMRSAEGLRLQTDLAEVLQTAGVDLAAEMGIATVIKLSSILNERGLLQKMAEIADRTSLRRIIRVADVTDLQEMIREKIETADYAGLQRMIRAADRTGLQRMMRVADEAHLDAMITAADRIGLQRMVKVADRADLQRMVSVTDGAGPFRWIVRTADRTGLQKMIRAAGKVGLQRMIRAADGGGLLRIAGRLEPESSAYQTVVRRLKGEV